MSATRRRRRPGPAPTLRRPVMVRFALDGADCRRLDRYAKANGINRSEALRAAVAGFLATVEAAK